MTPLALLFFQFHGTRLKEKFTFLSRDQIHTWLRPYEYLAHSLSEFLTAFIAPLDYERYWFLFWSKGLAVFWAMAIGMLC